MTKHFKNLLFIALITIAASCGTIKGAVTVAPNYYITDISGYQMIFKDKTERVENALRSAKAIGTEYITVKKVVKGKEETWEVTTLLEDVLMAVHVKDVEQLKDAEVIKIPLSRIADYTREVK